MTVEKFLETSYTPYHVVRTVKEELSKCGFIGIESADAVERGGKYFFDYGAALIAVSVGENNAFHIAESHVDSPCLRVKTVQKGSPVRLDVEKYGGGIMTSFLDRKLRVAGRIVTREKNGTLKVSIYDGPTVVAPSLAPHFGGDGSVSVATDLYPILCGDGDFLPENTVDYDLFAVPCESPFNAGVNNELLCAPRIDNLTSVYASVKAVENVRPDGIAVCALFNNEEVGSGTPLGAGSDLLRDLLIGIAKKLGFDYFAAVKRSLALSVDNAHALHPAHPEKADPASPVSLGGGIVVKHHTNYSTDALTAAAFKEICRKAGVEYQDYYHPSDLRCGSTLGPISAVRTGISACDIGVAQLAMHSALETVAAADIKLMQKVLAEFFSAPIPVIFD